MVKFIVCARRKPGLTRAEFSAYWRDHHGPLVRSVPELMRHVRKYVQCHLVDAASPFGDEPAYDGIAELWFDNTEEITRAFNEPRYLEIIRPDELKFVDLPNSITFIVEEITVV